MNIKKSQKTVSQRRIALRRRGASMVEYALLLFAVLIIAATAFKNLGKPTKGAAEEATKALAPS